MLVGNLGIGLANIYFLGKKEDLRDIFGNTLLSSLVANVLLIGFYLAAFYYFQDSVFKGLNVDLLLISVVFIPLMLLSTLLRCILIGKRLIHQHNLVLLVQPTVTLLALIFFLIFATTLRAATFAFLLGYLAMGISYTLIILRLAKGQIKLNFPLLKKSVIFGMKGQFGNVFQFFNYRLDFYLVNLFLNPVHLGFYAVSTVVAELLWKISSSAATILMPKVAAEDSADTARFSAFVSRSVFVLTLILAISLGLIAKPLIVLFFGVRFAPAYFPFILLLPGVAIMSVAKVLAGDLVGRGKPEAGTIAAAASLLLTVVLDLLLIPRFGINGAAIASSLSYIAATIIITLFFLQVTKKSLMEVIVPLPSDTGKIIQSVGRVFRK